jgi:hypothetical protein
MISRDRGLGLVEERIEILTCPAMRMLLMRLPRHQVDHIRHLDPKIGKDWRRRMSTVARVQAQHTPAQAMTTPGSTSTVVAGPLPDADPSIMRDLAAGATL